MALILYFGARFFNALDVSDPLESKVEFQKRAAAFEKAMNYQDWTDFRVRRGGWLKAIVFWPIEPTEVEVAAASEFVHLVILRHSTLKDQGKVCGNLVFFENESLFSQQIEPISEIATAIQDPDLIWQKPALRTLLSEVEQKFPCP